MPPESPGSVASLLLRAMHTDATRPLLTFYDDATGERVELSVATYENWVAKTANFLRDGLGVTPGARVAIRLPAHWQSAVWLGACWATGAVAAPVTDVGDHESPAAVAVVAADDQQPPPNADDLVVLGLGPFGLPRPHDPSGMWAEPNAVDFDAEIHSHGDRCPAPREAGAPDRVALEIAGVPLTNEQLVTSGYGAVQKWGLRPGDRVLVGSPLNTLNAILATVLAPLATGGGAVLCRHVDVSRLPERAEAERLVALLPWQDVSTMDLPDLPRL